MLSAYGLPLSRERTSKQLDPAGPDRAAGWHDIGANVRCIRRTVLSHEHRLARTEAQLRLVRIVSGTPQLDVLGNGRTTARVWHDVVKFEHGCLRATPVTTDEGAAASVARPDCPLHSGGNVARAPPSRRRRFGEPS